MLSVSTCYFLKLTLTEELETLLTVAIKALDIAAESNGQTESVKAPGAVGARDLAVPTDLGGQQLEPPPPGQPRENVLELCR